MSKSIELTENMKNHEKSLGKVEKSWNSLTKVGKST